jgi:transcriptional regulator of aromatic amino acid metabolism
MAKRLYNDTMVRSQCGAFTIGKLDSGETVDDLLERLQNLAVDLPELEGAAGDAVLLQRFIDALQEELQVHACGISGDYDQLVASLSRI